MAKGYPEDIGHDAAQALVARYEAARRALGEYRPLVAVAWAGASWPEGASAAVEAAELELRIELAAAGLVLEDEVRDGGSISTESGSYAIGPDDHLAYYRHLRVIGGSGCHGW
jgi:hypothetical protein